MESFRFWDENGYEYEIFSMNNSERSLTSVILVGKTSYRRHFSTRFFFYRPIKTSQQHGSSLGIFRSTKKVKLPAIKITEEPTLLTKSKINRPGYESFQNFR